MFKLAFFTEGQSEQIFIRHMLLTIIGYDRTNIKCYRLQSRTQSFVPYAHSCPDPYVCCSIFNVGGDEGVLSAIREREKGLFEKGYHMIIGLRDMYSDKYRRHSSNRIDKSVNRQFINGAQTTIREMSRPDSIKLYFAIMEWEAWILGMYSLFPKINILLTTEYIHENLNIDLKSIDPQAAYFKPSLYLKEILALVGLSYSKSLSDIEGICSKMGETDFEIAIQGNRCGAFRIFYDQIRLLEN